MQWSSCCDLAPWPARSQAGLAALPGGELLLLGGLVGPRSDVWRSNDSGVTWQRLVEVAPWPARSGHGVVVLPGGAVLLLGGSGGPGRKFSDAWRSVDSGATWHRLAQAAAWPPRAGHAVTLLPGGAVLLLGGLGPSDEPLRDVWRSTDGGASWEQLLEEAPWPARTSAGTVHLRQARGASAVLILGGLAGDRLLDDIWRSRDGGATWELLQDGAPWAARCGHAAAAVPVVKARQSEGEEAVLLLGGLSSQGPLADAWRSLDGGATWKQLLKEAEWAPRLEHRVTVLADASVLLLGGQASAKGGYLSDVWRGFLGDAPPRPPPQPQPTASQQGARYGGGYPQPKVQQARGVPPLAPSLETLAAGVQPQQQGEAPGGHRFGSKALGSSSQGQSEVSAATLGGNPAWPRYETMPAFELRRSVLELQKGLADITRRLDGVCTENTLLREENSFLKEAIDDKIEGMR